MSAHVLTPILGSLSSFLGEVVNLSVKKASSAVHYASHEKIIQQYFLNIVEPRPVTPPPLKTTTMLLQPLFVSQTDSKSIYFRILPRGGGGVLPYMGYIGTVCAAPKGMVFQPFWS